MTSSDKMLMRQIVLVKRQHHVPVYVSAKDIKKWLLAGRSFLDEFQDIAKSADPRKLLVAELAWTSARRLCLHQLEQELQEELQREKRLSELLGQKVTLEGLQMFLSIIRPKAEQDVRTFLHHLSNKLLDSFAGFHTSKCSKLALLAKLHQTMAPLAAQVVETALEFLLGEPEQLVEVRTSQTQGPIVGRNSSLAPFMRNRAEAASAQTGKQLADAASTCFCLNTSFTQASLLCICTSVAQDMVKAIYRRFVDRSKTFHLMNFDESFVIARRSAVWAIQDMVYRAQSAANNRAHQSLTETSPMTPEVRSMVAAKRTVFTFINLILINKQQFLEPDILLVETKQTDMKYEQLKNIKDRAYVASDWRYRGPTLEPGLGLGLSRRAPGGLGSLPTGPGRAQP
ncbi:hypothetical protein L3Q82_001076 [Scortum barcoo]|uniref:Uncharacterized protein n=1 Tax=Scortum barcoo TaxID=214431 RepID=A0ACB8WAN5_9TELE|nr:hypothetical protein L3Q82_001076 [Scortum barcoo]